MVFPWHVPYSNPDVKSTFKDKALQMLREEVKYRARILHNLGYSEADVTERLSRYSDWDFERTPPSPIFTEIGQLVKSVYGQGAPAAANTKEKKKG